MSLSPTARTQELLTTGLSRLSHPDGFAEAAEAYWEFHGEIDAIFKAEAFDGSAAREMTTHNASASGLDTELADGIWTTRRRPRQTTLSIVRQAKHPDSVDILGPNREIWLGTGGCLVTLGTLPVYFSDRPGIVEQKYGPAMPWILRKLGLTMLSSGLELGPADKNPGYREMLRLQQMAQIVKPDIHIGATTIQRRESVFHASASGVLPTAWHNATFALVGSYAAREVNDKAAGLHGGWDLNVRGGLNDARFAGQIVDGLVGIDNDGQRLTITRSPGYNGVDIN